MIHLIIIVTISSTTNIYDAAHTVIRLTDNYQYVRLYSKLYVNNEAFNIEEMLHEYYVCSDASYSINYWSDPRGLG